MPTPFYADDAVTIWHGNALDLSLDDASVDLVVTSPPYFGLRAYSDGGETYGGQIGSEATPGEFLDALAAATREMARVLKPSGSIFVNLGDKYSNPSIPGNRDTLPANGRGDPPTATHRSAKQVRRYKAPQGGIPAKSLMLLPERYRIRCVDDLGLIARAVIVWAKPNSLPESVRDRVRRSHEDWVHLTKAPRYFTGIDEIREPYEPDSAARRVKYGQADRGSGYAPGNRNDAVRGGPMGFSDADNMNPLGKLPGSVWTIPTQPLRVPPELGVQHFAAFPFEFPRRIIRGWSPSGICVECGEGRRPVVAGARHVAGGREMAAASLQSGEARQRRQGASSSLGMTPTVTVTGYACACNAPTAPTRPAVILDPFGGTGTTGVVAKALGRQAHLVDLSRDYCRLAQWRVNDPKELAKAGQVKAAKKAKVTKMRPKPPEPEQGSLLDDPAA